MSAIPKFVASPHDDDDFWCVGEGNTPEDALSALLGDASWLSYSDGMDEDASIPVYVYTCIKPENSDWPEESIEPHWKWVAHERVKTVNATTAGKLIPPYSLAV